MIAFRPFFVILRPMHLSARHFIVLFFLFFSLPRGFCTAVGDTYVRYQKTDFLTFEELRSLSEIPEPTGALRKKLDKFWKTPILSNAAYYSGVKPLHFHHQKIGPSLVVGTWNIEKSIYSDQAELLLTSKDAFEKMLNRDKLAEDKALLEKIRHQRAKLSKADILILQEMDIGHKRSGYRDAAAELAQALGMNYAYGPQQLEIDPVVLGTEQIKMEDGSEDQEAEEYFRADPALYKGVFGSAVLSRYPIKYAEVFQLDTQPYDWYRSEKQKTTYLESFRRVGTKTVFKNEITREMKVGGRIYFRVDLDVPEIPGGTLTVINIHLEIKCEPKGREAQMNEILSYIKKIKNPVIMAGDFNAAPQDLSPTSLPRIAKRAASNPTNWLSLGINAISPHALVINTTRGLSNLTKNFQDPTTKSIKVIAPNPLKPLFEMIRSFRFKDGGVFDFRGDPDRSTNQKKGWLANSNERDLKGFKTTFNVKRPIGPVGKYRLDWFFMKVKLKNPSEPEAGPYRLQPHFGETLEEMNTSLITPISDHHPNIVLLPLEEPQI